MPKSLKEICYSDPSLVKYVTGKAHKLYKVYRNITEVEDLEHELWAHAFEAIDKRYDGKKPLAEFVRADVYSAYGHLLPNAGSDMQKRALFGETHTVEITEDKFVGGDKQYPIVDAMFTISQIESDLRERYHEARYYRIGYDQLQYFKLHDTDRADEFASQYGISRSYSSFVYRFVKKIARKYSPHMLLDEPRADTETMEA